MHEFSAYRIRHASSCIVAIYSISPFNHFQWMRGKLRERKIQNVLLWKWCKKEWTPFPIFINNITSIFDPFISYGGRGDSKFDLYIIFLEIPCNQFIPKIHILLRIHSIFNYFIFSQSDHDRSLSSLCFLLFTIPLRQKACYYPTRLLLKGVFVNKSRQCSEKSNY